MRAKWSAPIRKYWKISEQMMVKYCDLAICDSVNIEKYIHECYDGKGIKGRNPKTTFIAYGADLTLSKLADDDEKLMNWYREKGLTKKDYYLVVGRFVPENSFEVMIREFMKSKSKKNFAIITNVNEKFLNELEEKLHFKSDKRIKFVGTVYDQELLKKIRENAYAAGKVAHCGTNEYYYRSRPGSITKLKYSIDARKVIEKNLNSIEAFIAEKYQGCGKAFNRYKAVNIYALLNKYIKCKGTGKAREYEHLMAEFRKCRREFFRDEQTPKKEKMIASLILLHLYDPYLRVKEKIKGYK